MYSVSRFYSLFFFFAPAADDLMTWLTRPVSRSHHTYRSDQYLGYGIHGLSTCMSSIRSARYHCVYAQRVVFVNFVVSLLFFFFYRFCRRIVRYRIRTHARPRPGAESKPIDFTVKTIFIFQPIRKIINYVFYSRIMRGLALL